MSNTTLETIGLGAAPNDDTGDPIRTGGQKMNSNFGKLFDITNRIEEGLLTVYRYPGNPNIAFVEQKDLVQGIIEVSGTKYFIKAQYNTGDISDFGTPAGFFNNGSYNTISFDELL